MNAGRRRPSCQALIINLEFSLFSPAFVLPDDEAKRLFVVERRIFLSAFYLPEAKERFVNKKAGSEGTQQLHIRSCCVALLNSSCFTVKKKERKEKLF